MDNQIRLVVFGLNPGNIKKAIMGEKIGTIIRGE
jgi:uridylate kinase